MKFTDWALLTLIAITVMSGSWAWACYGYRFIDTSQSEIRRISDFNNLPIREDNVESEETQTMALSNNDGSVIKVASEPTMLEWVIMCESSGHQWAIGKQGEIGLLQYKIGTFRYFSNKYKFVGDINNRQDQIDLFLLTSEEEKYQHWSCFRKYLKYEKNILN